jgi:hypothetical protein
VILVHRLLKNSVSERLGHSAYVLYSDACIQAAGIDPVAQGLIEHHESVDIIGEVTAWYRDLRTAWRRENELTRLEVKPEDAYLTWKFDIPAQGGMTADVARRANPLLGNSSDRMGGRVIPPRPNAWGAARWLDIPKSS